MSTASGDIIEGVEEHLQPGERLVWTGRPERRYLARHVMHVRGLIAYFIVLLVVPAIVAVSGERMTALVASAWWVATIGGGIVLFAWFLADMIARTSIYAVTDRRVVMRIGIAIPVTLNLPFDAIEAVAMRERVDGSGELALRLQEGQRIAYALLWPHARPWQLRQPQPTLRGIAQVATVGAMLRRALGGVGESPAMRIAPADVRASSPVLARQ